MDAVKCPRCNALAEWVVKGWGVRVMRCCQCGHEFPVPSRRGEIRRAVDDLHRAVQGKSWSSFRGEK